MNNSPKSEYDFWKNKTIISYFLAVFVVILHIDSFSYYASDGTTVSFINDCFYTAAIHTLSQVAVPLFYIISAAVFFRDYSNSAYLRKMKGRIRTLIIPYLIWNTVGTACACVLWASHREMFFGGNIASTALNWFEAIFHYKCYRPFWFIFNLIVFFAAAPLVELLLKNRYVAIACIIVLIIGQDCGIHIPEALFFRSDSAVYLMIGSYIGRYAFDTFSGAVSRKLAAFSVLGLLLYLLVISLSAYQVIHITPAVFCFLIAFGGISFWFVFSGIICPHLKSRPLYENSFAVYAMHFYINYVVSRAVFKLLPNPIWAILNFIITLVMTLVVVRVFCIVGERYFTKIYNVIMGERG